MTKLCDEHQVWVFDIDQDDIWKGVHYAKKSLPWTFNRMGVQEGDWTWYYRMMKIVVGVAVQETLIRELQQREIEIEKDWTNYRTKDAFDLTSLDGRKIDVKSFNLYSDYSVKLRPNFCLDYLIQNSSYPGPEWSRFFPCLVPQDQAGRDDVYVFAIVESPNYTSKARRIGGRVNQFMIASPAAAWGNFLNHKNIIKAREDSKMGLDLEFELRDHCSLFKSPLTFYLGLQYDGKFDEIDMEINTGDVISVEGVSGLSYIRIREEDFDSFTGQLAVRFTNHLDEPVFTGASMRDLNVAPENEWVVDKTMFGDLFLPSPHRIYMLGWISIDEFSRIRREYPAYAHPLQNKQENQLADSQERGIMLTRSCCYIYPNMFKGGLRNKNYYVLPRDLNIMDELPSVL